MDVPASPTKKNYLNIFWVVITILLIIQAVYGEIDANRVINKISKKVSQQCLLPTTNICDRVTLGYQLSDNTTNSLSVKWRRGFMSSIIILNIVKPLLNLNLDLKQSILFVMISWIIIINFEGYNDYHMRETVNYAINDCLFAAITDISSQAGSNCDVELYNDILSRKRK